MKPRCTKLNPRVDYTAMVSISFLLIVFYMIMIELSKPNILVVGLPEKIICGPDIIHCGIDKSRVTTLLLDDNNQIICYTGLINYPDEQPKTLFYGKNGIRKELIAKSNSFKKSTSKYGRVNNGAIVIIKPSKKSTLGNLVSVLDEMNIANISTYTIINDFTPEEMKLLTSN